GDSSVQRPAPTLGREGEPTSESPGANDTPLPRPLAGYTLLGVLGRGGTSVVYPARQASPARVGALEGILGRRPPEAQRRGRRPRRPPPAPPHRPGSPGRHDGRVAVPGAGVPRRGQPGPAPRRRAAATGGGCRRGRNAGAGRPPRPRARRGPPRPQAGQHPA